MGHPAWADGLKTMEDRLAGRDVLDAWVQEWTGQRDKYEAMHYLQAHGVPAGAVQDAGDRLERDPQLADRHHFTRLRSTEVGELPLEGVPFRMSATPPHTGGRIRRGPPDLGEDTDEVLGELLGLGHSELAGLRASGVLA